jgi:hypothetical protein
VAATSWEPFFCLQGFEWRSVAQAKGHWKTDTLRPLLMRFHDLPPPVLTQ